MSEQILIVRDKMGWNDALENRANDVLTYINWIRRRLGYEKTGFIARGDRFNHLSCPIANSIPEGVKVEPDTIDTSIGTFYLPTPVKQFVRNVDAGWYPEYVTSNSVRRP